MTVLRLAFVRDDLEGAGGLTLRPAGDGALDAEPAGGVTDAQVRRICALDLGAVLDADRPVLFGTPYEAAAWSILSARGPVARAAEEWRTLRDAHGLPVELGDGETRRAFPLPRTIRGLSAVAGVPDEKLWRLHGVAEAALAGELDAGALAALPAGAALARLKAMRGIGGFYAELILAAASPSRARPRPAAHGR